MYSIVIVHASAGWADGFMDDANKAVEEAIRLEESVPIEEDKSLEGWTTVQYCDSSFRCTSGVLLKLYYCHSPLIH
jgi:hypothetical protein